MDGLVGGAGFGTTELIVLRPEEDVNPRFLYYVTQSSHFRSPGEAAMLGSGGQKRVPDLFVKDFETRWPSLDVQLAIASYLDAETARIDSLIERKRALKDLLAELRAATITDAVLGRIDVSTGKRRDSSDGEVLRGGAEGGGGMNSTFAAASPNRPNWLVGVPSQWEIAPIKAKADVRNGATPSSGEERFWEGEIPWATPVDLGVLELRRTGRYITREGYESCGTSLVPAGSVIISTRAPIGSLALAGVDMCFNQGCRGLVPGDDVSGRFLYYALSAFSDVLQVYGEGTTFKELSSSSLSDFPIAWPSLDEQHAIAAYLDAETARIDDLIAHVDREIALLQELRSATITDAVLGRIDVREHMKH